MKEKDDELDRLKLVLGLNDLGKRLSALEGPIKRHSWSVQFLELRALNQDFMNLKQLPQSIIRDNLISDIEAYLYTGETLSHSLKLQEVKISELMSVIDEYDIAVRDLKEKCESLVEQEEASKATHATLLNDFHRLHSALVCEKSQTTRLREAVETLSNKGIPILRLFKS